MKKFIALIIAIFIFTFSIATVVASNDSTALFGDADGDERVTVKDATLIQKHIADLVKIPEERLYLADVDNNGNLNIIDATYIQKKVASVINLFPAETAPIVTTPTSTDPTEATAATLPTATEATNPIVTTPSVPVDSSEPGYTDPTEPTTETNPIHPETSEPKTDPTEPSSPSAAYGTPNEMELEIFNLINKYRAENGVSPLEFGNYYYQCAKVRAEEGDTLFSHTRPDDRGFFSVFDDFGILHLTYGENIARYFDSAETVMDAFMNSPNHRANILYYDYDYVAVAVYESKDYPGYYVVEQLFNGD